MLVGFRTPLDAGQVGTGEEVFTTICAFNAAGVRSILLSRWAVGGESSAIALRELLQELPFTGMNASWSRARMMLRRSELDPVAEPLLTKADHEREGLTGDEPLFWAGYMVSSPNRPRQNTAK
jgi:CHAT domain-containing protein